MQIDEETRLLTEIPQYATINDLEDSPLRWPVRYKWTVIALVQSMIMLEYVWFCSLILDLQKRSPGSLD